MIPGYLFSEMLTYLYDLKRAPSIFGLKHSAGQCSLTAKTIEKENLKT